MTSLVSAAVNPTLQKFELKPAHFIEMEEVVPAERQDLERGRQQLFLDRMAFRKRVKEMHDGLQAAGQKGGDDGIQMAREVVGGLGGARNSDSLVVVLDRR